MSFDSIFFFDPTDKDSWEKESKRLEEKIKINDNNKEFKLLAEDKNLRKAFKPRKLVVCEIPGAGFGLFSGRKYMSGEIITTYDGKIICEDEFEENCEATFEKLNNTDYVIKFMLINSRFKLVDGKNVGNMGRFVNTGLHSNVEFTCGYNGEILIQAKDVIQEGDQFIVQYGLDYEEQKKNFIELDPKKNHLNYVLHQVYDREIKSNNNIDLFRKNFYPNSINYQEMKDILNALNFPKMALFNKFFEINASPKKISNSQFKLSQVVTSSQASESKKLDSVPQKTFSQQQKINQLVGRKRKEPESKDAKTIYKPNEQRRVKELFDLGNIKDKKELEEKIKFKFDEKLNSNYIVAPINYNGKDEDKNYGLFAKNMLKIGTLIPIAGIETKIEPEHDCYFYHATKNYYLDCKDQGNESRFIQGSSKPNVDWNSKKLAFLAIRDILPGEEITALFNDKTKRMPLQLSPEELRSIARQSIMQSKSQSKFFKTAFTPIITNAPSKIQRSVEPAESIKSNHI